MLQRYQNKILHIMTNVTSDMYNYVLHNNLVAAFQDIISRKEDITSKYLTAKLITTNQKTEENIVVQSAGARKR